MTGIFYLLVVLAETFGAGRHGIPGFTQQANPLGYLTSRYWSPSALWAIELVVVLAGLGFVIATFNVAIRVMFAMGRERVLPETLARLSRRRTPIVSIGCVAAFALLLGLPLTYGYGGVRTFGYIAGAGGLSVVLVYLAVNIAVIRAFRTEFRDEFGLWRHLLVPATAIVLFLFPLWGILHPRAHTAGGPAALHRARLALPRGHRRRHPPGPASLKLPDAGPGIHASRWATGIRTRIGWGSRCWSWWPGRKWRSRR